MKTILIVDEEKISVSGIIFTIEQNFSDIQILTARTCSEALEVMGGERVDLIILDMMIPKGTMTFKKERIDFRYGIDLLIELRNRGISIPIICYTIINNDDSLVSQINDNRGVYLCKLAENSTNDLTKIIEKKLY